jgi:hypothetical protein
MWVRRSGENLVAPLQLMPAAMALWDDEEATP